MTSLVSCVHVRCCATAVNFLVIDGKMLKFKRNLQYFVHKLDVI